MLSYRKYLFFDIFIRNNELIIIGPIYYKNDQHSSIDIYYQGEELVLKKIFKKAEYEPILVMIFDINLDEISGLIDIVVKYKEKNYTFALFAGVFKEEYPFLLTQTTLFKNDYALIDEFCKYYRGQGVEHFYLYYNGAPLPSTINHDKDITYLQWNFHYFNNGNESDFIHHAQLAQMHHALYKYGKILSKYMLFNDLDEYTHADSSLKDLCLCHNSDVIAFLNCWCEGKFTDHFKRSGVILPYGTRSKCLYKTKNVDTLHIHHAREYNISNPNITIDQNYLLYHFYNWSKKNRIVDMETGAIIKYN
jgi:hypothetical protein